MKILLLAPQPFFQERGTPIAVRLAAQVIANRPEDSVTLMTYAEGVDVEIPNVSHRRVNTFPRLTGVQPGFSIKKLYYDLFFLFAVFRELWRNRNEQYDLIHAVEESVFFAWVLKPFFRVPFIYDMDSSLSLQLVEKLPALRILQPFFKFMERQVIQSSVAVVPVCDALDVIAQSEGAQKTMILRDISLLEEDSDLPPVNLHEEAKINPSKLIVLYVGNLESYQGIDLMLDGFAVAAKSHQNSQLIVIGGTAEHRLLYTTRAHELGIPRRVSFLGPRPVTRLSSYLKDADILISPRTLGNNTPMKIYSYIHSGVPVVATRLPTHTQVLTDEITELVDPTPEAVGAGLLSLLQSEERRKQLGETAQQHAEERYTFEVFEERLNGLYDGIAA